MWYGSMDSLFPAVVPAPMNQLRSGKRSAWYTVQAGLFFLFTKKKYQNHIYNDVKQGYKCWSQIFSPAKITPGP
jgi:hypothetical protein